MLLKYVMMFDFILNIAHFLLIYSKPVRVAELSVESCNIFYHLGSESWNQARLTLLGMCNSATTGLKKNQKHKDDRKFDLPSGDAALTLLLNLSLTSKYNPGPNE